MSIAGKTMLLAVLILGLSGAQSQSFAQETLIARTLSKAPKSVICSPLESLLVIRAATCELKTLPQADTALKAQEKKEDKTTNVFSYATEPTYYAGTVSDVQEVPQSTITPAQTVATTPTSQPLQQAPINMVPADSANLNSDLIFDFINTHRAAIGKPVFQKEGALCSLAATRSVELQGELFGNAGYLHSGLYNRNLPYWITENAKWGSNEVGTVQWWLNSPIHRSAIEGDYTYSCGACHGSKCAQLFTSYTPKGYTSSLPSPTIAPAQ